MLQIYMWLNLVWSVLFFIVVFTLPFCTQVILQRDFHVINALALVCGQDRTLLASILLRIFRHEKAEAPLLRTLNDKEINMEGTVFPMVS